MKKSRVLAAFILAACLLAACAAPAQTEQTTQVQTSAPAETTVYETDPEPTEPPFREASEIKVGMIFFGEKDDGSVLSASLQQGLTKAAEDLGIAPEQILWKYNSREASWTQIEDSILECVDNGCQIIFGGAREYAAVIAAIAEEYPDVMFACVGSDLYNGSNSGTFDVSLGAAQYLCGVAAGLRSQTGHVGFLAAKNTSDKQVTDGVNAFAYGVWTVNPDAVVEVGVTGKWFLPQAEQQGVTQMLEQSCDVIGAYTDCSTGVKAAVEAGAFVAACGAEGPDLYGEDYETRKTGAALWDWSGYFSMKLEQVLNKEIVGEAWLGDYYSAAAVFLTADEMSDPQLAQAREQLILWRPVTESENETVPQTESDEAETELQSDEETESDGETEPESEPEPEEISVITIDEETGYLSNVRVSEIEFDETE